MEQFVKMLYDRLEDKKLLQLQLYLMMQNAINEMHNNGIIASLSGDIAKLVHDPDPEVRVREKTRVAKAVGKQFVLGTVPLPTEEGLSYVLRLNYDSRFVNSITLCIQGGIEGLHMARISNQKIVLNRYIIHVLMEENDISALRKNVDLLNQMYDDIVIELECSNESHMVR